jgi:hypothetical protein
MARRYYGIGNLISHCDFVGHAPQEFAHVPFVSGHFGYDFARVLMPDRYSFTFLRPSIIELPKSNVTSRKPSYENLPSSTQEMLREVTSLERLLYDDVRATRPDQD